MKHSFRLVQATSWMGSSLLLALAGAAATASSAGDRPAAANPSSQARRAPLSGPARAALHNRMANHGADMAQLVQAVVLLKYQAASDRAHLIATEPKVAREYGTDLSSVNAQLPARFFDLQDDLAKRAGAVDDAARAMDDTALAVAYWRLAAACIACHSAYLPLPEP